MRHISLESGIGGFDYAAEMMGWDNVAHCEINTFCLTVLKYYWPDAEVFTDLFTMDGRKYRGTIGVITCGFPCQPFSTAGKGKGDKDDRFIWPENMRIIREVQPVYVVAENVPGLVNKHGMVFERVCADLENEGYEVITFNIPACGKEAVHKRERIWIVAYNHGFAQKQREQEIGGLWDGYTAIHKRDVTNNSVKGLEGKPISETRKLFAAEGVADVADVGRIGQSGQRKYRRSSHSTANQDWQINRTFNDHQFKESWPEAATRLCRMDDEFSGRLDTKTISKRQWYNESIRGYGNAIYWKVALEIFKAIESTRLGDKEIK